jgi:hypothetical protein
LADRREPENFFREYSTKLPEMRRAFWGQAVRNMYILQEFEMAYLVRAQMHKPRFLAMLVNQVLKDESPLKLRRCRNKRKQNYARKSAGKVPYWAVAAIAPG